MMEDHIEEFHIEKEIPIVECEYCGFELEEYLYE